MSQFAAPITRKWGEQLLFTDLRGSTALYDRVGDLAAFDLVRDLAGRGHAPGRRQVARLDRDRQERAAEPGRGLVLRPVASAVRRRDRRVTTLRLPVPKTRLQHPDGEGADCH